VTWVLAMFDNALGIALAIASGWSASEVWDLESVARSLMLIVVPGPGVPLFNTSLSRWAADAVSGHRSGGSGTSGSADQGLPVLCPT